MAFEASQRDKALIEHMLRYREYRPLAAYIRKTPYRGNQVLEQLLALGQAILEINLETIDELAPLLDYTYLTEASQTKRKVYSFTHYLNLRFEQQAYGDYLRALTPILVDVFRLLIEADFMPDLSRYIQPVIKPTVDGHPLYRGLQWKETLIESSEDQRIQETWQRYYGERFNYEHYVSSSHLLKLIADHSSNEHLKDKANQMRYIEKYLRNIVAHEVIYIDQDWFRHRIGEPPEAVHDLYHDLLKLAGLTDQRQWQILDIIAEDFMDTIKQYAN
ncbi:hypothetical protein CL176_00500 [Suicoccus acidiformans]|uniref:Csm6 HEPN domain-containing protein n=1 Tax=Suicoccus acidiformans TaxID=2036206 RepID=A0A347WHS2_9LACT|nr:hypothetical protein [Suicoccus acidiformans]AXY24629.1 hypothetical protein CL176_00500 [Suicoccus acidiformans]